MKKLFFFLTLLCSFATTAQVAGDVAQTFGGLPWFNNVVRAVVIQPDDKVLVGGNFVLHNGATANGIIRLNADGTRDTSFNTGNGFNNPVFAIALQPDGKILVGGQFNTYNGVSANFIIRLNSDGTRDTSFNTVLNSSVNTIALQSDGKILVGGSFTTYDGFPAKSIIRLNADGTRDAGFTIGTGFEGTIYTTSQGHVYTIVVESSGKILVGGDFTSYNGVSAGRFLRLNSDGTRDTISFAVGTGFDSNVTSIALQPDGKILVGGNFTSYNGGTSRQLIRLNTNGTSDSSFTINTGGGFSSGSWVHCIAVQSDGKIIVGGSFSSYNGITAESIVRLNADSTRDTSFNVTGVNNAIRAISFQSDGKILVGGDFTTFNGLTTANRNVRLNTNGSTDTNFHVYSQIGFNGQIKAISTQLDGKMIVGGTFTSYKAIAPNDIASNRIKRLNIDGSIDTGFNMGTGFNSDVNTIALQPDGKILIGGGFTAYNGVTANRIVRLNADGTVDSSFNMGVGFNSNSVNTIYLQPDGKMLVGGSFSAYNGVTANVIIRLNADGTRDTSFIIGTGFNGIVNTIALQPDGKVLVCGGFTSYNGVTANRIIRLNADGSTDAGFSIGTGFNNIVNTIALQTDGKVLVGGIFTTYNGVTANRIIRLNADGSIDAGFSIGTGFASTVSAIVLQPDGKILVGGDFTAYNGVAANRIIRLNAGGSIDASFTIGSGFNNTVNTIALQPDGTVLVGGAFTAYKGITNSVYLIRLHLTTIQSSVSGTFIYDADNNGCTVVDPKLTGTVTVTNGSSTAVAPTNHLGGYLNYIYATGTYTLTPTMLNPAYFTNPAPGTVTFASTTSGNQTVDFCFTANGTHNDLQVTVVAVTPARPGFDAVYKIIYKNQGTHTQPTGTVSLAFNDAILDYVSAAPAFASLATGMLSWNFTNLAPFETREITVTFNVNSPMETPAVNNGDILTYTATITGLTDETPADNVFTLNQVVVGSYDPNDKTCMQGATITTAQVGEFVDYVIRFENTGTYMAEKVVIKDIIDTSKFDIASITPIKASHSYIIDVRFGNEVYFTFDNINLPFDDANNDGYVAFKIKTKSTLVAGDTFTNGANIYFDYNPAIVTNVASTAVVTTLGVSDFDFSNNFVLYPNPAQEVLHITSKNNLTVQSVAIYNMLGQQVLLTQHSEAIDVSSLSSGNYVLKIISDQGVSSTKFIKE